MKKTVVMGVLAVLCGGMFGACGNEDSGVGRSIQDLEKMLSNTTLMQEFSVSQHDLNDAEGDIRAWLESLKLAQ